MNQLKAVGGLGFSLIFGATMLSRSIYQVETGHKAFKFNKLSGVGEQTYNEGWHLRIPWFERPVIFNVRSNPKTFNCETGSKDLQKVRLSLRVLYRPSPVHLQTIYRNLGRDYDARVLPSVVNEVLRSVVA